MINEKLIERAVEIWEDVYDLDMKPKEGMRRVLTELQKEMTKVTGVLGLWSSNQTEHDTHTAYLFNVQEIKVEDKTLTECSCKFSSNWKDYFDDEGFYYIQCTKCGKTRKSQDTRL